MRVRGSEQIELCSWAVYMGPNRSTQNPIELGSRSVDYGLKPLNLGAGAEAN